MYLFLYLYIFAIWNVICICVVTWFYFNSYCCLYLYLYFLFVLDCIGRESWAFGCFQNTSFEMLSQEWEGGSSAFAAKYQIHIHFTNNSSKIKTRLKFTFWYEFSKTLLHKFESWNQILQAPTHQPSCYQIFWTNLKASKKIWEPWHRRWLTVRPFTQRLHW